MSLLAHGYVFEMYGIQDQCNDKNAMQYFFPIL